MLPWILIDTLMSPWVQIDIQPVLKGMCSVIHTIYWFMEFCKNVHEIHVLFKKKKKIHVHVCANFDHELDNNERCLTIIYYTLSLNVHAKSFNYEKNFLF